MPVSTRVYSENTAHLHIVVPPDLALALRQYAAMLGMKPNAVVVFALTSYLSDAKEFKDARRNLTKRAGKATARAKAGRNGAP